MRAVVDAINAFKPSASFGFLTRGVVRERVGSGKSMVMLAVEVAARGFTEKADGEDKIVETKKGAGEFKAGVFSHPQAFSSRTNPTNISFRLASSIINLFGRLLGRRAFSV